MKKQIPEGPKGKGLRELKEKAPEVVASMGYNKGGAITNKPKNDIKKTRPKVGTGKKPKGSGRRLYTDENQEYCQR